MQKERVLQNRRWVGDQLTANTMYPLYPLSLFSYSPLPSLSLFSYSPLPSLSLLSLFLSSSSLPPPLPSLPQSELEKATAELAADKEAFQEKSKKLDAIMKQVQGLTT